MTTKYSCNLDRKNGIRHTADPPKCTLGHSLTFTRMLKLAQYVQPQWPNRAHNVSQDSAYVFCWLCERMFICCPSCASTYDEME